MSRKHFRALADSIAQITDDLERERVAHAVGVVCQSQNPRFDWSRWNHACKV